MKEGKILVRIKPLLDRLRGEEGYKPLPEKRKVPTIQELAKAANISSAAMSNIVNNKVKQVNIEVLSKTICLLKHRGFDVELTDVIEFEFVD